MSRQKSISSFLARFALMLVATAAALTVCELLILSFFWWPSLVKHLSPRLQRVIRHLYMEYDRPIVQYMPECARFDSELFYTLRPGQCTFKSREFSVELAINHLGVRDSEDALIAPEIVVLGDSYAMGWGVEKRARFADRLKELTGYRVLDAGVSSYGTVRELRMLERVDLSHVKFIVLEYDVSDDAENHDFVDRQDTLRPSDEASYARVVGTELARRRYFWCKYVLAFVHAALFPWARADPAASATEPAEAFLHALEHAARRPLDGIQLIAMGSHEYADFFAQVDALRHDPKRSRFVREMKILDLTGLLTPGHYFLLDDHLNPKGHALVARELFKLIGRKDAAAPQPPSR
jgi:hypothetical protein